MERDELERKAEQDVELPKITAHGYVVLVAGLVEVRADARPAMSDDARELLEYFEAHVPSGIESAAHQMLAECGQETPSPVPEEEV